MIEGFLISINTCKAVQLPEDYLETMYELLQCRLVQAIDWETSSGEAVSLYLDEEALLSSGVKICTLLHGAEHPVIGNILVLGPLDEEGGDTSAPKGFKEHDIVSCKKLVRIKA